MLLAIYPVNADFHRDAEEGSDQNLVRKPDNPGFWIIWDIPIMKNETSTKNNPDVFFLLSPVLSVQFHGDSGPESDQNLARKPGTPGFWFPPTAAIVFYTRVRSDPKFTALYDKFKKSLFFCLFGTLSLLCSPRLVGWLVNR